VIGPVRDPSGDDLRQFLSRNHVPFEWLDPDDPVALSRMPPDQRAATAFPLLVFRDGAPLTAPSRRALASRLGMQTAPIAREYDLAIIGGGPAGLAAAVYGASEGLRTVLVEQEAAGGQAGTSSRIENYLGFPAGLSGEELTQRARRQAMGFGAEIVITRSVTAVEAAAETRALVLDGEERVGCRTILIATGVAWRLLPVPGLDRLVGRGVTYGGTPAEALSTRGKNVFLIGGGNSAGQAALFFASYARQVTILIRGETLAASMSRYLIDQLAAKTNIAVEQRAEMVAVAGDDQLEAITVKDLRTGSERTARADALFVFIGADARTAWLPAAIARDGRGFVVTGREAAAGLTANWPLDRDPYLLETSAPGIFAAGDVRSGSIKRVASGVGEGSMAVAFVHQYLDGAPESAGHQPD